MRTIWLLILLSATLTAQTPAAGALDQRVAVTLKSGAVFAGVAKGGVVCEQRDGGRFVACADRNARGAGIRLWYVDDADGWMFLDYSGVKDVVVKATLTPGETRALNGDVARARPPTRPAPVVVAPKPATTTKPASPKPATTTRPGTETKPAVEPLTAAEEGLLERFPPDKGWEPAKRAELYHRQIVVHIYPNTEERAFIDVALAYDIAFAKWKALHPSDPPPPKPEG